MHWACACGARRWGSRGAGGSSAFPVVARWWRFGYEAGVLPPRGSDHLRTPAREVVRLLLLLTLHRRRESLLLLSEREQLVPDSSRLLTPYSASVKRRPWACRPTETTRGDIASSWSTCSPRPPGAPKEQLTLR